MEKILNQIKYDLEFMRSHTLQPKWFKILKVFILLGVFIRCFFLFGLPETILFIATFVTLMLVVHFSYRKKTNGYTTSWLDFVVIDRSGIWSISVSGNWRVTFKFEEGNAQIVNYEDYH